MQSPELTPTPSAKLIIPPDSKVAISESRLSGARVISDRDDLLDERSVTTLPDVIVPIWQPQNPRWPLCVIALALLLSLLWSGTLVWISYRLLLSALSMV